MYISLNVEEKATMQLAKSVVILHITHCTVRMNPIQWNVNVNLKA